MTPNARGRTTRCCTRPQLAPLPRDSPGSGAHLATAPCDSPHLARLLARHRPHRRRDAPPRLRSSVDSVRRPRLARDLLHDRDGALADERNGHGVGAHAVACGAVEECRGRLKAGAEGLALLVAGGAGAQAAGDLALAQISGDSPGWLTVHLAGLSCHWIDQSIIIETVPSSDRRRWCRVGHREPVIAPAPFRVSLAPIPHLASAIGRQRPDPGPRSRRD